MTPYPPGSVYDPYAFDGRQLVAEALKSAAAFGEIHSIAVEAVQAKVWGV